MKFQVHMLAFMKGEIREVNVPDENLGEDVNSDLEEIFKFGQNDYQPIKGRCSVSSGDVIDYNGQLYLIAMAGFRKMSAEQFENYKKTDRDTKFKLMFEEEK